MGKISLVEFIEKVHPFGDVLEIGFGVGSKEMEKYHLKSLLILEECAQKFEKAQKWAENKEGVTLFSGFWQNKLPSLGTFDCIYLEEPFRGNIEEFEKTQKKALGFLKEGKKLQEEIYEQFPEINTLKYKESEVFSFCETMKEEKKALSRFLAELFSKGQISDQIYEKAKQKYVLEDLKVSISKPLEDPFSLIRSCFENHLRGGGSLAFLLPEGISVYENSFFLTEIIAGFNVDFFEYSVLTKNSKQMNGYLVQKQNICRT